MLHKNVILAALTVFLHFSISGFPIQLSTLPSRVKRKKPMKSASFIVNDSAVLWNVFAAAAPFRSHWFVLNRKFLIKLI